MNGVVILKVKGKDFKLRFGYTACMEFEQRLFNKPSTNPAKILTDLIYSGLFGEAMRSELPTPTYSEATDLMDDLSEENDYSEQVSKVWETYNTSKWGADFQERLKEFNSENKKKE